MAAGSGRRLQSIPNWDCCTSPWAIHSATARSEQGSTSSPIRSSRSRSNTGKLKWYFQQTHHDVWDYDSGGPPILFDMQVRGQRVKAVAEASKNGYLYILNRETGQPVHPIKETPVPTETALPGEQPWPTQPIPYKANGQADESGVSGVSRGYSAGTPCDSESSFRMFTPLGPNQIFAPGTGGGANYGPISYSPRTGLLYVNAIDSPTNVGTSAKRLLLRLRSDARESSCGNRPSKATGRPAPSSPRATWCLWEPAVMSPATSSPIDAKTGDLLWKFNTGSGVFGSPAVYMVNGEQFVTVASGGGERGRRGGDLDSQLCAPEAVGRFLRHLGGDPFPSVFGFSPAAASGARPAP